jgi:plasmid rolling circle replication initiator protein Rep
VAHTVTAVPLKSTLTLSVTIKRLKNFTEMKNGEKNKNQEAVRDIGRVLQAIKMATVREF